MQNTSRTVRSFVVIKSTARSVMSSALLGMMPCHPRKGGKQPTNSRGQNVISSATTLVNHPTTALTKGMMTVCRRGETWAKRGHTPPRHAPAQCPSHLPAAQVYLP